MAVIFKAKARQFNREQDQHMRLAWHTALLPRLDKFPPLETLLIVPPPRVEAQSETESWNTFVALKARMENP